MKLFVVLHNIRSAHNVGSIFRSADGAGVDTIFLCGYTPAPTDRFGRPVDEILKTSLGATSTVQWEQCDETVACLESLRQRGVTIVAVEQCPNAALYTEMAYPNDVAFVFGNEIDGVPKEVCDMADSVVYIPMHGKKESLNVGVSAGIVLFDALRKRS